LLPTGGAAAIATRWFELPNVLFFWWVPAATMLIPFAAWRSIERRRDVAPFLAIIVPFLLGYLGLLTSNFRYLISPALTMWEAAAAPATQFFMLMGTLVMLPIIVGYVTFVYWIFGRQAARGRRLPPAQIPA
jgi:cytochrome d ubiquinol oxidase subunit II